jgi:hypothetical protein
MKSIFPNLIKVQGRIYIPLPANVPDVNLFITLFALLYFAPSFLCLRFLFSFCDGELLKELHKFLVFTIRFLLAKFFALFVFLMFLCAELFFALSLSRFCRYCILAIDCM